MSVLTLIEVLAHHEFMKIIEKNYKVLLICFVFKTVVLTSCCSLARIYELRIYEKKDTVCHVLYWFCSVSV